MSGRSGVSRIEYGRYTHGKEKTLPKDFEQLVQTASDEDIKKVLGKCDINAYGGYNKGNALEFPLSEEMMRWLIEQGIDINYVDQYGYTPLLYHAGRMSSEKQAIALVTLNLNPMAVGELDYKDRSITVTSVHSGSHSKLHFRQESESL